MSEQDRFPDRGDLDALRSAAWQLQDVAEDLSMRMTSAQGAAARITASVWSGQGADAYRASAAGVDRMADSTVQGWQRVVQALLDCVAGLSELQDEATLIRSRLSTAEAEAASYRTEISTIRQNGADDPSTGPRMSWLLREAADAGALVAREWSLLDDIGSRRRALDARVAEAVRSAPGPGAAAWAGLAYRPNGTSRPEEDVVTDILDLLNNGDGRTAADYDLIAQFLAMYSADSDVMAMFYDGLGPDGLAGFMSEFNTADDLHGAFRGDVSAAELSALLSAGLATASLTWDDATARQWGSDLIDTMDGYARSLIVPALLGASGLNPQVAVGAFQRVEHIRENDPERFALITRENLPDIDFYGYTRDQFDTEITAGLGGNVPTLMGAIFSQLTHVPGDALDLFSDSAVTDFWFGMYDWGQDRFEGPAALMDAIVNSPEALAARLQDPLGDTWTKVAEFASLAAERLGGNQHYRVDTVSPEAKQDIAQALRTFIPEISAMFGGMPGSDDSPENTVRILVDGEWVDVPALSTAWGNLSRLLGVACTDVTALADFGSGANSYAGQTIDLITSQNPPSAADAKDLLRGIGGLYGLIHGSYAAEAGHHADVIDATKRAELDTMMRILGLIPGVSTGRSVVDWLAQVAVGNIDLIAEHSWSGLLSADELAAIRESKLDDGHEVLNKNVAQNLTGRTASTYDVDDLVEEMSIEYSDKANSFNNVVTEGRYDVAVLDADGILDHRNRQDMP